MPRDLSSSVSSHEERMVIADVRQSKAPGAVTAVLNRVWPSMVVALAIVANVVWIGVLGYALVALF
jgi:hypothetical protein